MSEYPGFGIPPGALARQLARGAIDDRERLIRWPQVVMAVGNFKRQRARGCGLPASRPPTNSRTRRGADHSSGPNNLTISRDGADSWRHLEDSPAGAATATTTTLLAALWPDSYHILDWTADLLPEY
jgi:hypothetical protein